VLLKLLALAPSGGTAKSLIKAGRTCVDGAVETRVRRKLRAGQIVRLDDDEIRIMAGDIAPVMTAERIVP